MGTTALECGRPVSTEERLLAALRSGGPQTIEMLASLPGLSWAPVMLAVDRLSRSGTVSLRAAGHGEYQVSIRLTAA